jgi:putative transposase
MLKREHWLLVMLFGRKERINPLPIVTSNKILKRNSLVHKWGKYSPKEINCPSLIVIHSNYVHQIDVVGPRYIKEDGKFYSINIIDVFDRRNSTNLERRQNRIAVSKSLLSSGKTLGIPLYEQMDNKLPLRGSNQNPHPFGLVIRLCLYMGIQSLFIPLREPWRNGIIEHFQNVFDEMFFQAQYFKDFDYLCREAKDFEKFHNQNHCYSTLKVLLQTKSVLEISSFYLLLLGFLLNLLFIRDMYILSVLFVVIAF